MTSTAARVITGPVTDRHRRLPVLLSVNVGLPKNVAWRKQTVYTGVWRVTARRGCSRLLGGGKCP
jgi:hypothetical protein